MSHPSNSEKLRQFNQLAILKTIRQADGISRGEIARELGIHPSTVTRLVEQLIARGLVLEREDKARGSRRGGRRAIPLEFNYEASLIVGVDLSGSTMKGALTNLAGAVIHRATSPIVPQSSNQNLARLITLVEKLLAAPHSEEQHIRGIGIGAPAVTLSEEGIVTWAPSLGWRELHLKEYLESYFSLPVFVENDVNLATLGEHWCGAGQGAGHVVGVFMGSGIGAGIIINNELYRGPTQAAGEVGYLVYRLSCFEQPVGDFGHLESVAAGYGIARRAAEAIRRGKKSIILTLAETEEAITAEHVFQAARQADPLAQRLVEETARYLSVAVAGVISILNPEIVVFGAGSAWVQDLLLNPITKYVNRVVPDITQIVPSQLHENAIVLGAVALVLHATGDSILLKNQATR